MPLCCRNSSGFQWKLVPRAPRVIACYIKSITNTHPWAWATARCARCFYSVLRACWRAAREINTLFLLEAQLNGRLLRFDLSSSVKQSQLKTTNPQPSLKVKSIQFLDTDSLPKQSCFGKSFQLLVQLLCAKNSKNVNITLVNVDHLTKQKTSVVEGVFDW